jgi:hypothetical protein
MPIIDLDTGKETGQAPEQLATAQAPVQQPVTTSNILDLDTGKPIEQQPTFQGAQENQRDISFFDSIGETITGNRRREMNPDVQGLPEFGATPEGDTPANALALLSTFDSQELKDILTKNVSGIKFEDLQDGTVVIETPTEEGGVRRSILNRAGMSPQDVSTGIAQALAFVPAARLSNLGKTFLQKAGLGAVGSAATELGRQGVVQGLGSEQGLSGGDVAITGALGAASEVVAPVAKTVLGQIKATQAADEVLAAQRGQEAVSKTGIELFSPQMSLNMAELEKQSYFASLPAGTTIAAQALNKQNKQAGDAVTSFINAIAPPESITKAGGKLLNAAERAVESKKQIRREAASPLYNQAFEGSRGVNTDDIAERIFNELDDLPEEGQISRSLKKVLGFIRGVDDVDGNPSLPSLKRLHNAKIEIDNMLEAQGDNALGNTTKGLLRNLQTDLLNTMDAQSPLYKSAREEFARLSGPVDAMVDAVRVTNLRTDDLKNITAKLFDTAESNPAVVLNAKKAIQEVDPEAWNLVVRAEFQKRLGKVKAELGGEDPLAGENVPQQLFNSIFGKTKDRELLYRALNPDQAENLKYLERALKRASKGRPGGSQTAGREEIRRELNNGMIGAIRRFLREPVNTVAGVGEELGFDAKVTALSIAMFDPKNKPQLKRLRKVDPASFQARSITRQLLNASIKSLPDEIGGSVIETQDNLQEEK